MDEKKKKPEEEVNSEEKAKENAEAPAEEKKNEEASEEKPKEEKSEEKASDDKQADENGEGAKADEKADEPKPEEKAEEQKNPDVPVLSEVDALKAENLTLKTQLEAMKIGFNPDCLEDAVVLAENIVKRDGTDISAALQAVAKKYPDWKADSKDGKSKGGFKVGADSSDKKKTDDDKLNNAFGIKKKK